MQSSLSSQGEGLCEATLRLILTQNPFILSPMRFRFLLAVIFTITSVSPGWSVQHLNPSPYSPEAGQCKARGISLARLRGAHSLQALIIGASTGAKTVAVIAARFPSASATLTSPPNSPFGNAGAGSQNQIQNLANIDAYFNQMKAYYNEVSYGKISVTFKFFGDNDATVNGDTTAVAAGSHLMPNPMEYYGCGDEYRGCTGVTTPTPGQITPNGNYLIKDALLTARAAHSNTPASTASGGMFDAIIVMHAGNGNETTSANGDIWSIFYSEDPIITSGGGGFTEGDVVPETQASGIISPLGVMCHEFGHELGLPDLYNTGAAGGTSVVGDWEIMDSGPFTGAGANPSHMGAWDKIYLGWSTPQVLPTRGSPDLSYVETNVNNIVKLPISGIPSEYFLLEYRSTSSGALFDRSIPGSGLLIWHIDDTITSTRGLYVSDQSLANTVNTGIPHYGVSIVPANGIPISDNNRGSAGNTYNSGSSFFTPASDTYEQQVSGISVLNINVSGGNATFDVLNLEPGSTQSILKVTSYPNPAGKGYPHPKGEGYATLQFQSTRPASDYQINIYTPSGDLVRQYGNQDIRANGDRSADERFIYEVDWDLKNGDGKMVAPGAYIIMFRVDGQSKSSKAVVIR